MCDNERCAIEAKEFLEVRFLDFSDCFYFKWLCAGVTHPRPLSKRGVLKYYFLFDNKRFIVFQVPLLRGD